MVLETGMNSLSLLFTLAQQSNVLAEKVTEAAELVVPVASGSGSGSLMLLLTVFVLAMFVGIEIITKIPPTLHTPLMSGSNAISGIALVGAILATGGDNGTMAAVLGFVAVVLATMNVVGGFVVTNRMLAMFKVRK
jgi:proton-translocating NAD(P)+ transhydrogenase subunit alpha